MDHDTRLSLAETAKRLGISERSVRRRLQNGSLKGLCVPGPKGPNWFIEESELSDVAGQLTVRPEGDAAQLLAVLTRLQDGQEAILAELAELREERKKAPAQQLPPPTPGPHWLAHRLRAWLLGR